jgi:phosphotransferase system enzyme I (PtsI)
MCGEMAGDVHALPLLVGLGLDAFSMSASSMLRARSVINKLDYQKCVQIADEALNLGTSKKVNVLVDNFLKDNKIKG